jgi:hypothetical protein
MQHRGVPALPLIPVSAFYPTQAWLRQQMVFKDMPAGFVTETSVVEFMKYIQSQVSELRVTVRAVAATLVEVCQMLAAEAKIA